MGGIYYQLQQWDNAQNQFQIAINLKPDFANSYYNLGHALEQKGELENALTQYELVKRLVANERNSLDQINKEINDLEARIKTKSEAESESEVSLNPEETLNVNTPQSTLPPRTPQVKIPPPDVATKSSR
ncbi:tetratricopeptide repeat protein [Candidatus Roizmanbacteria bacterium]|nr:tetratricopeptide repeat protein [Candidatus Roizmanbacteria bacterium]